MALLSIFNFAELNGFSLWGFLLVVDLSDNSYNGCYCYYFSFSIISAALKEPVVLAPVKETLLLFLALCPLLFMIPEDDPTLLVDDCDTAVDFLLCNSLLLLRSFEDDPLVGLVLFISLVLLLEPNILVLPWAEGFLFECF